MEFLENTPDPCCHLCPWLLVTLFILRAEDIVLATLNTESCVGN
jgi:hypothetical protein